MNIAATTMLQLGLALVTASGLMIGGCGADARTEADAKSSVQTSSVERPDSEQVAAPDFSHPTLDGGTFKLSDEQGKIVVLNFWATWCGPCREEIPDFIELQEEMSEHVQFVGVALDEEGTEVVRPFVEKYDINYPIVVDDSASVARKYGGVRALPTTYVINREGNIRYRTPGRVPKKILQEALREMIDR